MPIDKEVQQAVLEVAAEMWQSEKVARRMISWLVDLSERELSAEEQYQHLETLKNAVSTPPGARK